jgi:hypothetical protein
MVARELKEQTDELLRREDSRLATFAGESAETANLELLALAKAQTNEGVDPREIWESTGWFKGKDGEWRFEIDDSKASMVEGEIIHSLFERVFSGLFLLIQMNLKFLQIPALKNSFLRHYMNYSTTSKIQKGLLAAGIQRKCLYSHLGLVLEKLKKFSKTSSI